MKTAVKHSVAGSCHEVAYLTLEPITFRHLNPYNANVTCFVKIESNQRRTFLLSKENISQFPVAETWFRESTSGLSKKKIKPTSGDAFTGKQSTHEWHDTDQCNEQKG